MRLYYYTSKQFGMKSLWEKRLKIGKYEELNDPFELQAYKSIEQTHHQFIDAVIDAVSYDSGVICFSETWKSNLMWAHYADKHRGLCLGFDIPEGPALTKIKYVKSRIAIPENFKETLHLIAKDLFSTILEVKSSQWAYEKEHRLRIRLQEKRDGIYYQKFDSILSLSQVIIGARCKLSIEDVKDALGRPDSDVDIWAVKPARTQFSMVANKAFGRERVFGMSAAERKSILYAELLRQGSK
jgi:hypothetical protein